jgi:opacity protein-like surface antigen
MSIRRVAITAIVIAIASSALAQPLAYKDPVRWGRWDFGLRTLYTEAQNYEGDGGSSVALEDDLGWGFFLGYNFNDKLRLAAEFGWGNIPYRATVVDADDPAELVRYTGRLSTGSAHLTGDWNVLSSRLTPYVNGSVGIMMVDTNITAGWGTGCWWDPWWGYICGAVPVTYGQDSAVFGLGVGARYHLNDQLFLKLGYQHSWISSIDVDSQHMVRFDIGILY